MNLFSFLVLTILTSALLDQIKGRFSEYDAEYPLNDERDFSEQFKGVSFNPGTRTQDTLYDYVQEDTYFDKYYTDRIIGGTLASLEEFPWQASMQIVIGKGRPQHSCGAAIISPFWLLSAAHCYYTDQKYVWQVVVGEHHLYRKDKSEQTFSVDNIYIHNNFSETSNDFDIALIRVSPSSNGRGIVFTKFVKPIRLPNARTCLKTGAKLLVSGWGGTKPCEECQNDQQTFSTVLLKTEVPIIDRKICQGLYLNQNITTRMVCAGFLKGKIDTCLGDSGGAAVYKQADSYVLYGIVSWGHGCAQANKPGVYTRVTEFLPWIHATMR